jgi:hypothetical protein
MQPMNERDQIEELCDRYADDLGGIFTAAVRKFYDVHSSDLLDISPVSRASLINDYIFSGMKARFQGIEGFEFIQRGNWRFVGYKSEILIRIKKISRRTKRPSVNKTNASLRFNTQQDMDLLSNRATNVYWGYFLTRTGGELDVVTFLCPDEQGNIAWRIDPIERKHQKLLDFVIEAPQPRKRRISAKSSEVIRPIADAT